MSTTSISPISPLSTKDIRSASLPFKRTKDASTKWANGCTPSSGVKLSYDPVTGEESPSTGSDSQREKVRPRKLNSQIYSDPKSHSNKTPKPYNSTGYDFGRSLSRLNSKIEAHFETTSPLSKSLLELLPTHLNNTSLPISTTTAVEAEVLYNFDVKTSPGKGVELGGLVEKAERKWAERQTERIVRGEYEVLDGSGERVVLGGKKGKKSPKVKEMKEVKGLDGEEDDGFELI